MVHGSWTSWTWQDNARRYALWEVMPEVRWYPGEKKAWYVGAMFKAGQFNYKFSGTGRQGDLLGGGTCTSSTVYCYTGKHWIRRWCMMSPATPLIIAKC